MVYCRYRLSDGLFLCGWPQPPDFNPATEGVAAFPEHLRPDLRLHRYDATAPDQKRLATAQELADYDAARLDAEAVARFDTAEAKMLKALAIWTAQKLGVPLAQARQEVLALYKSL